MPHASSGYKRELTGTSVTRLPYERIEVCRYRDRRSLHRPGRRRASLRHRLALPGPGRAARRPGGAVTVTVGIPPLVLGAERATHVPAAWHRATDGIAEAGQGVAGGPLHTSFQSGAALGLSSVAPVNIGATDRTSATALLDGYRSALVAPPAAALIATAVSAFGLRRRSGSPHAGPGAPPRTAPEPVRQPGPLSGKVPA
ncbi:hypothetical protein [Streptomyces sp. NPDC057107]|uniref:hypothetical protein n=1 Tax=Streptomyces sp. NPDC057107 TaxID=3346021 RepID=UPI003626C947